MWLWPWAQNDHCPRIGGSSSSRTNLRISEAACAITAASWRSLSWEKFTQLRGGGEKPCGRKDSWGAVRGQRHAGGLRSSSEVTHDAALRNAVGFLTGRRGHG